MSGWSGFDLGSSSYEETRYESHVCPWCKELTGFIFRGPRDKPPLCRECKDKRDNSPLYKALTKED